MWAHIFNKSKDGVKGYLLCLTTSAAMRDLISESWHATKADAKRAAKEANAKPWNYN